MAWLKFLSLFFVLLVAACGGGSGGGGSKPSPDARTQFPEGYTLSEAAISRDNAHDFLFAHQQFFDLIRGMGSDFPGFVSPNLGDPTSLFAEELACLESQFEVEQGDRFFYLRLKGCEFMGYILSGEVDYSRYSNQEISRLENKLAFSNFRVTGQGQDIVFNGELFSSNLYGESTTTEKSTLELTDNKTGKVFAWTNLHIDRSSFRGDVYAREDGFVRVNFDRQSQSLRFTGAKNSELNAALHYDESGPVRALQSFTLSLTADEQSNVLMPSHPVPASLLLALQQRPAEPPELEVSGEVSPLRLDESEYRITALFDENYDFLDYRWELVSTPDSCGASLSATSEMDVAIAFECPGAYRIRVTVSDGHLASTNDIDVNVVPLLAEIVDPGRITVSPGQVLDVQLNAANTDQDGPFVYSLLAAPNGVSVDENGRIYGVPEIFLSQGNTSFSVVVKADNGRSSEYSLLVEYQDTEERDVLVTGAGLCGGIDTKHWGDINGDGRPNLACANDESFRVLELADGNVRPLYASPRSLNPAAKLIAVAQQDIDADGQEEILVGYSDQIVVVSGSDFRVVASIPLPWVGEPLPVWPRYQFIDQPNGGADIVVVGPKIGSGSKVPYLFRSDGSYRTFGGVVTGGIFAANIDEDSAPELWETRAAATLLYDLGQPAVELAAPAEFLADIDGDGAPELIDFTAESVAVEADTVSIYHATTGALMHSQAFAVGSSGTGFIAHVIDVDSDNVAEIVLFNRVDGAVDIYEWAGTELSLVRTYQIPEEGVYVATFTPYQAGAIVETNDSGLPYTFDLNGGFKPLLRAAPPSTYAQQSLGLFPRSDGEFALYTGKLFGGAYRSVLSAAGVFLSHESLQEPETSAVHEVADGSELLLDRYEDYALVDGHTQATIARTSIQKIGGQRRLYSGDVNGDGQVDFFSGGDSRGAVQWFSVSEDLEYWRDEDEKYRDGTFPVLIEDLNNNGRDEVYVLRSQRKSFELDTAELQVFEYQDGVLELSAAVPLEPHKGEIIAGVQDVDGDGQRELVVSQQLFSGACTPSEENGALISVYSSDLSLKGRRHIGACVTSIASFPEGPAKHNILAGIRWSRELIKAAGYAESSHLVELSTNTEQIIWESAPFLGRTQADGVRVEVPSGSGLKATLNTAAGLYLLR